MKERMYVILAAMALLVSLTVSIVPAAAPGEGRRGDVRRPANEQVARLKADAECQSGHACGG